MNTITVKWHGHVAEVALNRASHSNSLILESFLEINEAGELLKAGPRLRAVVLTGEGKHFCAGLDPSLFPRDQGPISWFNHHATTPVDKSGANLFQHCATLWRDLPVPVIAALHGAAYGGGCQLALGADIRLADASSKLSLMETHWGLIPDMAITQTLPMLLPMDIAAELILTAKIINADEALRLGLITRICNNSRDEALALAATIAEMSPEAIRSAKQLYTQAWKQPRPDLLQLEATLQAKLIGSAQQVECVNANLAQRKPDFN